MIEEKEALKKISDGILKRCKGDAAELTLMIYDASLTRFANNIIHQNVAERDAEVTLRYFIGKQIGTASTNRMDQAGLDELVRRARANATASPEDPNYPGLPEPAAYQQVAAWDQNTADYSPEKRARAVGAVCQMAVEKGLNSSGAFSTGSTVLVVANTQGVFTYHTQTSADFQTVVMSDDSSGRAQESAWKADDLAVEALGKEAIETAAKGHNPRKIDPGEYTVIFEHYVTEDLISGLNFYGMGAQALQEGRSWMTDRIGQQIMSPLVSIWDDGMDLQGAPLPFDFEGVPKQRVDIVKQGVVMGPVYDRYSGAKMGKAQHRACPTDQLPWFRPAGDEPVHGNGRRQHRGHDRLDEKRPVYQPLLVHPPGAPARLRHHRHDPRWGFHDRGRRGGLPGQEPALHHAVRPGAGKRGSGGQGLAFTGGRFWRAGCARAGVEDQGFRVYREHGLKKRWKVETLERWQVRTLKPPDTRPSG